MRTIRNKNNILKWSMLIFFLGLLAAGGGAGKTASAASVISLQTGTTYQEYDITGDGKADTLLMKDTGKEYDSYKAFKVYVNGKCALTAKGRKNHYFSYYDSTAKLVSINNGTIYLYVHLGEENDDGSTDLYTYQNGKLKKALNLIKPIKYMGFHSGADIHEVNGDRIVVWMESMSYGLAHVKFEAVYQYKEGKLVLQSQTHPIIEYYNMKRTVMGKTKLTTSGKMQLYQTKKLKKKSRMLAKGAKVYVTKCYVSGKKVSFCVKTADGKTGWFRSKYSVNPPFQEIGYAG